MVFPGFKGVLYFFSNAVAESLTVAISGVHLGIDH